jgi:predicted metalloprotease with PDZ domain
LGVINWNTCLIYPEVANANELKFNVTLKLPPDWKHASSLRVVEEKDGRIGFRETTLETLIDSPLIAGRHFRSSRLSVGKNPPTYLDIVAESAAGLKLDPSAIDKYSQLVREACDLFGTAHFDEYHFLVTCSDELGSFGLEHHHCSFNGVGDLDLVDAERRRGWVAGLLPHEFAHSWCGKFRRPAEMCVPDFHTPQRTRLLWVYEGLTTYLGDILTVRSGLMSQDDFKEYMALTISDQLHRKGRKWRPLEDTAVANHLLRLPSSNWPEFRRDQDYYAEGGLLWWEVDGMIRQKTKGQKSLDDFCHVFMGKQPGTAKVVPYTQADVVQALKSVAEHDWDAFFARRVAAPMESFPLDVVELSGYRVGYTKTPSSFLEFSQWSTKGAITARDSLGLSLSSEGKILNIVPEMVADKHGLSHDMQVIAVNSRKFSTESLMAGLVDSVKTKKLDLLVLQGEMYKTITLAYSGGPRYLELRRDNTQPDMLAEILKPRLTPKKSK